MWIKYTYLVTGYETVKEKSLKKSQLVMKNSYIHRWTHRSSKNKFSNYATLLLMVLRYHAIQSTLYTYNSSTYTVKEYKKPVSKKSSNTMSFFVNFTVNCSVLTNFNNNNVPDNCTKTTWFSNGLLLVVILTRHTDMTNKKFVLVFD